MKERKYKEDWVNETRFDEKTGREKRVPVYRGDWYHLSGDRTKRKLLLEALLPWIGFVALILAYYKLNFPGATVLYVFLPAAFSLFPALYWILGVAGLFRTEEKMTRLRKENGIGRILRSAAGCTVCAFAAILGDIVFLLAGSQAGKEWPGTLMLVLASVLACGTVNCFRGVNRTLISGKGDVR